MNEHTSATLHKVDGNAE